MTQPLTKAGLITEIAELAEIDVQEVKTVLAALGQVVEQEVCHGIPITVPGVAKIAPAYVAAKPRRKGKNPWTGDEQVFDAKPARIRLKVRPTSNLRRALPGPRTKTGQEIQRRSKKVGAKR